MRFSPKTEDELARESLLEAGAYPFEILDATDTVSKNGNDMIKLKLNIFGNNGEQVHVYDYLLEKLAFKLRHFAETTSLLKDYESGQLDSFACVGKTGFVKLDIEEQVGYSPRNVVKDYVAQKTVTQNGGNGAKKPTGKPLHNPAHAATMAAQAPISAAEFDDSIPF